MRLRQIEQEDTQDDYDILVKPVEALTIASARSMFPLTNDTYQHCAQLATVVYNWLQCTGSPFSDRWYSLYHETASESHDKRIDIEMAIEVERSLLTKAALLSVRTGEGMGAPWNQYDGLSAAPWRLQQALGRPHQPYELDRGQRLSQRGSLSLCLSA